MSVLNKVKRILGIKRSITLHLLYARKGALLINQPLDADDMATLRKWYRRELSEPIDGLTIRVEADSADAIERLEKLRDTAEAAFRKWSEVA